MHEQLLAASASRQVLDGGGSAIDAEDIRHACRLAAERADPFGLRIRNAVITGRLDLRAVAVPVPLRFIACTFTAAPMLDGADLHALAITDGRHGGAVAGPSILPGLVANGVRIRRDLVLSGTVITGAHATVSSRTRTAAVWLTEAEIGGRLLAAGTRIEATGDRAMQCDRTRVAGDVRLIDGFWTNGELRLPAMRLEGSLDLTGACLEPRNGRALDFAEATVGNVFLLDDAGRRLRPRIHGRVECGGATVSGHFLIRNADLRAPEPGIGLHDYNSEPQRAHAFLLAERLTVHGECAVEGETVVRGGLHLPGADLRGGVRMDGAVVWNAGGTAIDLSQSNLGAGLSLRGSLVEGTVNLANARIGGPLRLSGAQLTRPGQRRCLMAVGVRVEGDVSLRGLTGLGGDLNFRNAAVAGSVDAEAATLWHPGGRTLNLHQAHVAGNVRLCLGFDSTGVVVLSRALVEGRLRLDGATLAWREGEPIEPNPRGSAVEAISTTVRSGIGLGWRIRHGAVDFTGARTTHLGDDPARDWPDVAYLSGFVYERFAPGESTPGHGEWDARVRSRWLARLEPFDPQAWEQLARVLRANGDHRGAEEVYLAQRRERRRRRVGFARRPGRLLFDAAQDHTVRYGLRPQRALVALLLLVVAVALSLLPHAARDTMRATDENAVVFTPSGAERQPADGRCGGGRVRCFNPWLYAIDTVVPIIDLHQRSVWYPSPDRGGGFLEWWLNLCTVLGWIASTVFALSFTRLGRLA